jgi:hypothetical protein
VKTPRCHYALCWGVVLLASRRRKSAHPSIASIADVRGVNLITVTTNVHIVAGQYKLSLLLLLPPLCLSRYISTTNAAEFTKCFFVVIHGILLIEVQVYKTLSASRK